jgi:hypothetical protein
MRTGYSTAAVLVGLALICLVGWAASHAPAPASSNAISATISPPPAPGPAPTPVPPCRASQLSLAYLTGQPVGGRDFGIIAIWDKSAAGCSLAGPVLLTGLGHAGQPVTQDVTYEVSAPGTLTAHGIRPQEGMGMGQGERAAPLIVAAEYSHDPRGGNKTCARRVEPATWRLMTPSGEKLTVANADPHATARAARGLPADHGLLTCRGQLDPPSPVAIAPGG